MSLLYFGRFVCLITVDHSERGIVFSLCKSFSILHEFLGPVNCLSQLLLPVDSLDLRLDMLIFINQLLHIFLTERF